LNEAVDSKTDWDKTSLIKQMEDNFSKQLIHLKNVNDQRVIDGINDFKEKLGQIA
jgi:hypothetical protein